MSLDQPGTLARSASSGDSTEPPERPGDGAGEPQRPRRRRGLIGLAIVVVAGLVAGLGGSWAAYARTDLPRIPEPGQTTRVQYSDGSTFATFAVENRTPVPLRSVPQAVRNAVLAAQDPDFYDDGTALGALVRAAGELASGPGDHASITEQYVREAPPYGDGRTGRARSVIAAHKLRHAWGADRVLKAYLNTTYFGRGAWGVQAASQAYFHVDVTKLGVAQGAVLAALISDPTHADPAKDEAGAKRAWNSVLDAMRKHGYLSGADRSGMAYPVTKERATPAGAWRTGSTGVLGSRIEQELTKIGLSEQDINTGGYVVHTTINPALQTALRTATRQALTGAPELESSAVAIDPSTGAVRAYYGGDRGYGNADLASSGAPHPAGPSFEPFVVAAAVTDGYRTDSMDAAVRQSSATVFSRLAAAVGPQRVAVTAQKAGFRTLDGRPLTPAATNGFDATIGLGRFSVTTVDQASAYATIAAYGVHREPYFVDTVTAPDGSVVWDHRSHPDAGDTPWTKDVGRDVSSVLQKAYQADPAVRIDRPAAVKAGGRRDGGTSDAWLGGYTPQLATAIWVGSADRTGVPPAERAAGGIDVRGAGVPGTIWRRFMPAALRGTPVQQFLPPTHAGTKDAPG
ncbi:transglycosylase domain-containing protein [Cryptosporangium sp. NPDC051539]|uniref:transglycosylase domain-containing protein n=1 Tax=Cryptosporangium sp. NPDC051539 TaxID=3363962 RepID=UPI0037A7F23E